MIAKVGSSTDVQGTINYLEKNSERVDWKATQHLASDDKTFVARQMEATAAMSRTNQPVYHFSIAWDVADDPTREQMEAVARQTLKDLGMKDHQPLIVAHNDHEYAHLHVMANRVHPETGLAWDRRQDYIKLERSLRRQERARGWKEVARASSPAGRPARTRIRTIAEPRGSSVCERRIAAAIRKSPTSCSARFSAGPKLGRVA